MTEEKTDTGIGNNYIFNVVYGHQRKEETHAVHKGNISVIWTRFPVTHADLYLYLNAYSYTGPQRGFNVLLLSEPVAVLPGQYGPEIWKHFDHVITLYDYLIEKYGNFSKCFLYRTGLHAFHTTPDSSITENQDERNRLYPIAGRINGICMVNGNKQFTGPGELYSKRIEAALWFFNNSDIPFVVYGNPPFFLPNYKGSLPIGKRLSTASRYKYYFCFENTHHPKLSIGYVEKILDCLEARIVPIYLGAPDIEKYIPEGCFIDFRKFDSYSQLNDFLHSITDTQYMGFIENIDHFVTTGGLRPYTWNRLYDQVITLFSEKTAQPIVISDKANEGALEWRWGLSPVWNGMEPSEIDSQPFWTFELHASTPSPIVDSDDTRKRPGSDMTHQERLETVMQLMNSGDYKEAINTFAYMGGGGNIELHYLFANLLILAKQYDNAKTHLELIIVATNGHSKAYNDLGAICLVKGEVKNSVEYFQKAIACDNKNYDAIENLMDILTRLDMADHAATLISDFMKSSPTDVQLQIIAEHYGLRKSTENTLLFPKPTDNAPRGELPLEQNVHTGTKSIGQHIEEHKVQRFITNRNRGLIAFGENPLVSIVCFVYNREKYITQTIESVLNQTYSNIELIILNDGSTDNTESIIKKYLPNPKIKYHYQENLCKSLGTSDIKFDILNNRSVELSSGDFVCVIGADDIYLPGRVEKQIEEFRKYPQLDISFCNARTINEQGNFLSSNFRHPRALQFTRYNLFRWLFTTNFIAHPSVMLKRTSFYEQGCYGGGFGCDFHFWLKTARKLNFKYLDEILWCYRVHEDSASTSSKNADMCIAGTIDVLEEIYGTHSIEDFYPEIASCTDKDQALYSAHVDFGNDMLTASRFIGHPRFAVREYEAALSYKKNGLEALNNLAIAHVVTGNRQEAGKIFNDLRYVAEGNDIIGHNINIFEHSMAKEPHLADYSIIVESINVSELKQKILFFEHNNDILPGSTLSLVSKVATERSVHTSRPESFLNVVGMQKRSVVPGLTSVIIPVSGFHDNLRRCIESINTCIAEPHEIVLAVKGFPMVPAWFKRYNTVNHHCIVIHAPKDAGFSSLCNEALKKATGQYVLILDGNTVMLKGSLEKMRECMDTCPEYGITVPMSNRAIGIQQIPRTQQMSLKDFKKYTKTFSQRNQYRYIVTFEIDCICVLIKRKLIDTIGLFNEQIEVPYFVINDCRMRALLEGYQALIAGDSCIYLGRGNIRRKGSDKVFHEQWDIFNPYSTTGKKLSTFVAMKNARDHHGKGLLDESVQAIMEGIKYSPEEEELYYCLAEILLEEKQYEEVTEAIRSLPEEGRNKTRALEILGYCSYYSGRSDETENYADRALSLSHNSAKALNLKGIIALKQENQEKAEALFQQTIAMNPSFADPYVNMGVMKWHNNKNEEALDLIEKGFILSPETGDFSTTYHSATTSLNEFSRSEQVVLEATGLFPGNKKLSFLFIDILLQQEKYTEAMKEIEHAMLTFGIDNEVLPAALAVREKIGPLAIDGTSKKTGTLSVCMIAKNEEKYIARCLASLTPVADEIIIVDTGSTDRTKDIAKVFGAKVYDLPWTDDFSTSRNHSLSFAKGQWILVHDADEVISSLDYDKLKEIIGQKTPQLAAYSLTTRNYTNNPSVEGWNLNSGEYPDEEDGAGWHPSIKTRLFRNDSRIRFQNQVHEFLEPSLALAGIEIKHCTIPIHHYGKLDQERSSSRAAMYFELGRKKMMSFQDTGALRELAIQAGELGKYIEALGLWEMYIKFKPDDHAAYFNMTTFYLETGEFEKALAAARIAKNINPQSKEALLGFATSSICWGDIMEAIDVLEGLLKKEPGYLTAMGALAVAYCIGEKTGKGIALLKEMQTKRYDCSIALHSLSKKLIAAGRREYAKLLLEDVVASGYNTLMDSAMLLEELNTQRKT